MCSKKKIRIIFSQEAEEIYKWLNKESKKSKTEKTIFKAVNKKIRLLKNNIHYGNPISKKLIPKEYKEKYGVNNLFRVELPNFWRMLYTLTNNETKIEIILFVIDLTNHKEYNKKFGYKKK